MLLEAGLMAALAAVSFAMGSPKIGVLALVLLAAALYVAFTTRSTRCEACGAIVEIDEGSLYSGCRKCWTYQGASVETVAAYPAFAAPISNDVEEPEFTRRYPAESCTRIEVTTTDGRRMTAETSHPKGHLRNPLTDAGVEAKFRRLVSSALGAERCDRVLAEVWNLENAATLDKLFDSLVISRQRT